MIDSHGRWNPDSPDLPRNAAALTYAMLLGAENPTVHQAWMFLLEFNYGIDKDAQLTVLYPFRVKKTT